MGDLAGFHDQSFVNVGNHTSTSDGRFNEGIKFLVSADCQLKVAGSNALDLEVLACVSCQFEDLSGEVLKDSS